MSGSRSKRTRPNSRQTGKGCLSALLLGTLILSASGVESDDASDDVDREAFSNKVRAQRQEYGENRARQDAAAGNYDEAARSLESAK